MRYRLGSDPCSLLPVDFSRPPVGLVAWWTDRAGAALRPARVLAQAATEHCNRG